jgi:hypothetical protein
MREARATAEELRVVISPRDYPRQALLATMISFKGGTPFAQRFKY